jgi:hypothetical protein
VCGQSLEHSLEQSLGHSVFVAFVFAGLFLPAYVKDVDKAVTAKIAKNIFFINIFFTILKYYLLIRY